MARLKGVDYNVMGNAITGESSSSRDRIESSPGRCFVEGIHGLQSPVMVKGTVNMFILIYNLQKMTIFAHQSTVGPEQFSFFLEDTPESRHESKPTQKKVVRDGLTNT